MSNIGNIFGNEGWIQSSIDRSRGKTRPGAKRRSAAKKDRKRRASLLRNDPLVIKHGGVPLTKKQRKQANKKKKLGFSDLIKSVANQKRGILDPGARPVG